MNWDFATLFRSEDLNVVVLNHDIPPFWAGRLAGRRVFCADGGANRLFDQPPCEEVVPISIVGDLDSLRAEARAHYAARGTAIVEVGTQDDDDVSKTLAHVYGGGGEAPCVVLGIAGGNWTQEIGNLRALMRHRHRCIVGWSGENVIVPLREHTEHVLTFRGVCAGAAAEEDTLYCGILPLVGPARVETDGLRWNLGRGDRMALDGLISTSNQVAKEKVVIRTFDCPVFFSLDFRGAGGRQVGV